MSVWTDKELRAAVRAYLEMLTKQEAGQPFYKKQYRNALLDGELHSRTKASVEYRMRNISSVLQNHGRTFLQGYLPAHQVGQKTHQRLWNHILEEEKQRKIPPIIFFNIGWMENYQGPVANDPTIGNHGYLQNNRHGDECYNFLATEGRVFGHRPGQNNTIKLERLGANSQDAWMDGVLVVWLARAPNTTRTYIVGWYLNARVYRRARPSGRQLYGQNIQYSVEASAQDATVLPVVARTFEVPSGRAATEGFGQSPTWYGSENVNQRIWNYILGTRRARRKSAQRRSRDTGQGSPRNKSPEQRRRIEQAAIEHAWAFYESPEGGSHDVKDRQLDACGWDLEATNGDEALLIEVKGLSGDVVVCELTPNEYQKMMLPENRDNYVLYIVCNALEDIPIASVFHHVGGGVWRTEDGRNLQIETKTGAVLRSE